MTAVILESERLYLKQFTDNDVDNLYRLNSDADVMKYIGPPITDRHIIEKRLRGIAEYYAKHPGLGVWAGFEKASDKFIGFYELAHLDNTAEIEVGYRLLNEFWGKGYATEMTKVLIDYGFTTVGLDKIVGISHHGNIPSQNVLLKSGLKYIKDAFYYNLDVKYFEINQDN